MCQQSQTELSQQVDTIEVDDSYALYAGEEGTFWCEIPSWEMDTSIISDYELKIEYSKY